MKVKDLVELLDGRVYIFEAGEWRPCFTGWYSEIPDEYMERKIGLIGSGRDWPDGDPEEEFSYVDISLMEEK